MMFAELIDNYPMQMDFRKKTGRLRGPFCMGPLFAVPGCAAYRLLNCLRRRALWKPTFLRSTSRASRVTKPALDSAGLSVAS